MVIAATEYRAHIDALNAEANRHLAEIQRIEEAKRLLTMTTEEKIRELRRQGMTEFEATEPANARLSSCKARRVMRSPLVNLGKPNSSHKRPWIWRCKWAAPNKPTKKKARSQKGI